MQQALDRLGNPERAVGAKVVHVAGTNGKGSVVAMCERLLATTGRRVARYTSPHLCRLTERFVIDGAEVEPLVLGPLLAELMAREPELTFFELCTLAAFRLFADTRCDAWVIEVGLGGRLDATNTLGHVDASIITSIGLDHQAILGDDVGSIAREKAGILRRGVPAFVGPVPPAAALAIEAVASEIGAPLTWCLPPPVGVGRDGRSVAVEVALSGAHQRGNATLAVAAVDAVAATVGARLSDDAVAGALSSVAWPGRAEQVTPQLLLDGAHNPDGVRALLALLAQRATAGHAPPAVLVFGASADKPIEEMLSLLGPRFDAIVLTRAQSERAAEPAELAERLRAVAPEIASVVHVAAEVGAALTLAAALAEGRGVVLCGSLFLVGEARARVLGLASDPASVSDPAAGKS